MGKLHQIAGALMAVVGMQGTATAADAISGYDPASHHFELYKQLRAGRAPVQLVLTCEQHGEWKSIPAEDPSAMGQLGKRLCTDQNFSTALPETGPTRDKYFTQLALAHRYLSERAKLGRPVQGAELAAINLPNMYVVEKPYAAANGGIAYQFQLTIRQPLSEGGTPLAKEQINGITRIGNLTGLLEVPRATNKSPVTHSTP